MAEEHKRKYTDRELFGRYIKRIAPFKKSVSRIAFFIVISALADIFSPLLLGFGVDELTKANPNFFLLISATLVYILLYVIIWVMFFFQYWEMARFVPSFSQRLRIDIFDKLQEQDMSFFDREQTGGLNTRVTNDVGDFGNITFLIVETIGNLILSGLTFAILVWLNGYLALIVLTSVPLILLIMFSLRKLARVVSRAYRKSLDDVNIAMVELVEGIHVCKSYSQEVVVSERFNEINKKYFKTGFKLTAVTHLWRRLLGIISTLIFIIIMWVGGQLVFNNAISPGSVFIFYLYLPRFFRPIMVLATFFPQFSTGMAAYERILDVLDSKPFVTQYPNALDVGELEGEIEFENVDFGYKNDEWVFKGLNLKIEKGEKLAIVGHTGSGKTSLVSLLARYYEFQGGSIKIDGIDIRNMKLESYRKNIGIVQQDVFLFSGTIEENIRYGRRDASEEDLGKAVTAVHAEELIEYLPKGFQTQVGERGKGVSVGQRQLISFARALLTNPKILILDEATSSVDAYTEAIIQESLEELMKGRTSIVIAHRLSTVKNVDRIIVLDHGKIIEEGTHDDLLSQGGEYATLYNTYFKHQEL
ncbi:MAG: ABC transporter ATP-binding protein [Candidatus Lokiarchaeota archaeon]|nr:ABC transporter ATP-binding protein [Candidatus Lokiarchaeota archaeon]